MLTSGLVATFLESLLFGAFTVLYGTCAWVLLYHRRPHRRHTRNGMLFIASTVMYALTLVVSSEFLPPRYPRSSAPKHFYFDIHIALQLFVQSSGDLAQMSDMLDTLNGLGDPFGAAKFGIYVTQTLIGDGFMVSSPRPAWFILIMSADIPCLRRVGSSGTHSDCSSRSPACTSWYVYPATRR